MCSPWYNHNGWLGIKHQLTYSNMCNVTGLGGVLRGGQGEGGRKQWGGGEGREWERDKSEKDWAILTGVIKAQSVSTQSEHFEMGGGGGGGGEGENEKGIIPTADAAWRECLWKKSWWMLTISINACLNTHAYIHIHPLSVSHLLSAAISSTSG